MTSAKKRMKNLYGDEKKEPAKRDTHGKINPQKVKNDTKNSAIARCIYLLAIAVIALIIFNGDRP